MNINDQLFELYSKHWDNLLIELKKVNKKLYTNPFLLKVDENDFAKADFKVMIFGQETKGWWDSTGFTESIHTGMDRYEHFFVKENFYDGYSTSAFWKAFRFFQKNLTKNDKLEHKNIIYIWNNISKIGRPDKKVGISSPIRNLERNHFSIVKEEIEIIKPNLIIFLSGPQRDHDIKHHFPKIKFTQASSAHSIRQMALVDDTLIKGLRLYHPSFYKGFNKQYKNSILNILNEII